MKQFEEYLRKQQDETKNAEDEAGDAGAEEGGEDEYYDEEAY